MPRTPKPTGRPTKLHQVCRTRDDGTPQTVAERIIELMATGAYVERAAAEVGISKNTVYQWLYIANQATIGQALGRTLTHHETECLAFADAVGKAEAKYELAALGALERIGRGGAVRKVTTTVETLERVWFPDGSYSDRVVGLVRTTREEPALPHPQTLQWKLTRRFPDRYADKLVVEQQTAGVPEAEQARGMADEVATFLAGYTEGQAAAAEPG